VPADIEGQFLKALESAPRLLERIRAGKRAERFVGTVDLPNFFRKPYGPGWALVVTQAIIMTPIWRKELVMPSVTPRASHTPLTMGSPGAKR
jgi:hypothetical protein